MKAYAIICEYGACSIYESIEMVCKILTDKDLRNGERAGFDTSSYR